jgi:hypothetical protein
MSRFSFSPIPRFQKKDLDLGSTRSDWKHLWVGFIAGIFMALAAGFASSSGPLVGRGEPVLTAEVERTRELFRTLASDSTPPGATHGAR